MEDIRNNPEAEGPNKYVLRLYVAGSSPKSTVAIQRIQQVCETQLAGQYNLEVIDIYKHPKLAQNHQIIAAPTLVRELPEPVRMLVGNLADEDRVLVGLDLKTKLTTDD